VKKLRKSILFFLVTSLIIAGCSSETEDNSNDSSQTEDELTEVIEPIEEPEVTDSESELTDIETESYNSQDATDTYVEEDKSPYTNEELESDPYAPSTNPDDYDENGQYVPADGPSNNSEDYDTEGNYRPLEDMTQEEIEAELETMLEDSLSR
jgi:hypothetical protein